jgi:hypothetical protein
MEMDDESENTALDAAGGKLDSDDGIVWSKVFVVSMFGRDAIKLHPGRPSLRVDWIAVANLLILIDVVLVSTGNWELGMD